MAKLNGRDGSLTIAGSAAVRFRNWEISRKAEVSGSSDSGSSGWTDKSVGAKDWTASFQLYADDGADLTFDVGDSVALVFLKDTGKTRSGTGIISDLKEMVDYEKGDAQGIQVSVEGDGALTEAWA